MSSALHRSAVAAASAALASAAMTARARSDGCPVKRDDGAAPASSASGCPMGFGAKNPKNNMAAEAQQARAPGQAGALATDRVASTIPQASGDKTWEYPSPQMFWNALVRKGKVGGATEDDMETVVAVHNAMNEQSWNKVLEWETLREGPPPTLARFTGRPKELSPKAQLKGLLGHAPPFDRHDWVVARGDDERRYVLDYYSDESRTGEDATPSSMRDFGATKSIVVDVRPALDGPGAWYDRCVAMPLARMRGDQPPAVPLLPTPGLTKATPPPPPDSRDVAAAAQAVGARCGDRFQLLTQCGDDAKRCADAAIALQHCVASVVCPQVAETFRQAALKAGDDPAAAEKAYQGMSLALEAFQQDVERTGVKPFGTDGAY